MGMFLLSWLTAIPNVSYCVCMLLHIQAAHTFVQVMLSVN